MESLLIFTHLAPLVSFCLIRSHSQLTETGGDILLKGQISTVRLFPPTGHQNKWKIEVGRADSFGHRIYKIDFIKFTEYIKLSFYFTYALTSTVIHCKFKSKAARMCPWP